MQCPKVLKLVICSVVFLSGSCSGATNNPLKIGVGRIVPDVYFDEHRKAVGFAVDVVGEAARREGISVQWVPLVKGVSQDLQSGTVDLLSEGMGTQERREKFYVSEPWWYEELSLLTRAEATLPPRRLGVQQVYIEFARSAYDPNTFVVDPGDNPAPAAGEARAVCSGALDGALITHGELHDLFLNRPEECNGVRLQSVDTAVTYGLSIISRKSEEAAAKRLRGRIDDLIRDGSVLRFAAAHPPISISGALQLQERLRNHYEARIALFSACGFVLLVIFLAGFLWDRQRRRAEQNQRLRAAMLNAEENVTRGLARELHDDITQRLAFLSMEIGRAVYDFSLDDPLVAKLRSFQTRIQSATEAVRQISHRMHPQVLDDLGLSAALEDLCAQTQKAGDLTVQFESRDIPEGIDTAIASCLYRVCQECLNNVLKHSHADTVHVAIFMESDVLQMTITDTGIGFDPEVTKNGLGTHTMNERVRLINGRISIQSRPGKGTVVAVGVPG